MVASPNNSDKSIHPQEGSNQQKNISSSFSPTLFYKSSHNLAIVALIQKWLTPYFSSCDFASEDHTVKAEVDF